VPRLGQRKAPRVALGREKLVRDLEQDARPVAGGFVGPGCPAMRQVDENLPAVLDDGVVLRAVDLDHGPDATGIVLVPCFVQTLVVQS
jgi:hypothetical protein